MDYTGELLELSNDDEIDAQRSIIRQSLDEIANDVGMAMRDSRMDFPLGLTVPNSGYAIVTMLTPVDPSEEDWLHATDIVCQIVAERLGGMRLRHRPLPCAMANAPISAADVTADDRTES
jgi:hypothetical protein